MPTYDYKCKACSHAFEQFQSMKDGPLRKCPKCDKLALERLIGIGAAVLFKGSGFYQTDYRSESYNAAKKADSGGDKGEAKSDAGGADNAAKPAAAAADSAAQSKPKPAEPSTKGDKPEKSKGPKKPKH